MFTLPNILFYNVIIVWNDPSNTGERKMTYQELRLHINSTVCDANSWREASQLMEFLFSNQDITWDEYEEIESLLSSKMRKFNI